MEITKELESFLNNLKPGFASTIISAAINLIASAEARCEAERLNIELMTEYMKVLKKNSGQCQ